MMQRLSFLVVAAIAVGLMSPSAMALSLCSIKALKDDHQQYVAGDYVVTVAAPDNEEAPTNWVGPISVYGPRGVCEVHPDVSMISAPIWMDNRKHLWVRTYSGGEHQLSRIRLADCANVWNSAVLSKQAERRKGRFILEDKKLRLDSSCAPV